MRKKPELDEEEGSAGMLEAVGVQSTWGRGVFFFFSYVETQQSTSQQSTLRKLDRVKEFLWEKSQTMTVVKFKCIE